MTTTRSIVLNDTDYKIEIKHNYGITVSDGTNDYYLSRYLITDHDMSVVESKELKLLSYIDGIQLLVGHDNIFEQICPIIKLKDNTALITKDITVPYGHAKATIKKDSVEVVEHTSLGSDDEPGTVVTNTFNPDKLNKLQLDFINIALQCIPYITCKVQKTDKVYIISLTLYDHIIKYVCKKACHK